MALPVTSEAAGDTVQGNQTPRHEKATVAQHQVHLMPMQRELTRAAEVLPAVLEQPTSSSASLLQTMFHPLPSFFGTKFGSTFATSFTEPRNQPYCTKRRSSLCFSLGRISFAEPFALLVIPLSHSM